MDNDQKNTSEKINNYYIYVLELNDDKWYVGKSKFPVHRATAHFHSSVPASAWTSMYEVRRVVSIHECTNRFDEDVRVLELMSEHGVENVRGGSFSQIVLDHHSRTVIERMLRTSEDRCYVCGEDGHFSNSHVTKV